MDCAVISTLKRSTLASIAIFSHVTLHLGAIVGLIIDVIMLDGVGAASVPFFVYTSPLVLLVVRWVIFCFHTKREIAVIEQIQDCLTDSPVSKLDEEQGPAEF